MVMTNEYPERYTILTNKTTLESWEEDVPDFTVVSDKGCYYADDLRVAIITPKTVNSGFTVEDVFDLTDALVVHEEYSSGFFTDEASIKELNEYFCWDGGAHTLMGEMLTLGEKIFLLLAQFDLITGQRPLITEIEITTDSYKIKEKTYKPLRGNVQDVIEDKVTKFRFTPKDGAPAELDGWWGGVTPNCGLFMIILDYDEQLQIDAEEQLELELEEDPEYEEALDLYLREMEKDDYPWDDDGYDNYLFEDNNYIDKWCAKKGLL
jgi:hypothetical protein